jgi:hypothetical protein
MVMDGEMSAFFAFFAFFACRPQQRSDGFSRDYRQPFSLSPQTTTAKM